MTKLLTKTLDDILEDYQVFIFDIWGVITDGKELYSRTIYTINKIITYKQVFFITNSSRSQITIYKMLLSWGINLSYDMVVTSGEIAKMWLLNSKIKFNIQKPIIYNLGTKNNNDILYGLNNIIETEDINLANILLLSFYQDNNKNLNRFDSLFEISIKNNIINICSNPDILAPNSNNYRYCAGYFANRIIKLGGKVLFSGKPHTEIYSNIFKQLINVPKKDILMIGDNLYTDILGANQLGIQSAIAVTKNYTNINDQIRQVSEIIKIEHIKPNFLIKID